VERYSSSNAAVQNPEKRVQLNKLEHFTIDYLQKLFKQLVTEKRKASEDDLNLPLKTYTYLNIPEQPAKLEVVLSE